MVNRLLLIATLIVSLASCGRVEKKQAEEKKGGEEKIVQKTFASPDDAGAALFDAAKVGDKNGLRAIFGPDGEQARFCSGLPANASLEPDQRGRRGSTSGSG